MSRTITAFSPYRVRDILRASPWRIPTIVPRASPSAGPHFVQRFITHLTLVAYLVGGWLLPAVHHHAPQGVSHAHGLSVACCASTTHDHELHDHGAHDHGARPPATQYHGAAAEGPEACQSSDRCGCGHESLAQQRVVDTNNITALSRTHSHHCVGLCAGCVAQSLVGIQVGDPTQWTWNAHTDQAFLADSRLVLSERYGFALSRGPPAAV